MTDEVIVLSEVDLEKEEIPISSPASARSSTIVSNSSSSRASTINSSSQTQTSNNRSSTTVSNNPRPGSTITRIPSVDSKDKNEPPTTTNKITRIPSVDSKENRISQSSTTEKNERESTSSELPLRKSVQKSSSVEEPQPESTSATVTKTTAKATVEKKFVDQGNSGSRIFQFVFVSALVLSVVAFILMLASVGTPWYYKRDLKTTTITDGRVYTTTVINSEYLYSLDIDTVMTDSKYQTTTSVSSSSPWANTTYPSLEKLMKSTLGLAAAYLVLTFITSLFYGLFVFSIFSQSLRGKVTLKMWKLLANIVSTLTLTIGLICLFLFFTHTPNYRTDQLSMGTGCVVGPCQVFFWSSNQTTLNRDSTLLTTWGPSSGWNLFFATLFIILITAIVSSPLLSKRIVKLNAE